MIPTASPTLTSLTVGQISAVALSANAVLQTWQLSTERIFTFSTPAVNDLFSVADRSSACSLDTSNVAVLRSVKILDRGICPRRRSCKRLDRSRLPFANARKPRCRHAVPQSSSRMITSWETSTSRLCQITRVGGSQRGIGKTLTRASRGDEVFQNVKAFTVVSSDRHFDGRTGCVGDQTTHTCQLTDLVHRTTGTGVRHHVDGVVLIKVIRSAQYVTSSVASFQI